MPHRLLQLGAREMDKASVAFGAVVTRQTDLADDFTAHLHRTTIQLPISLRSRRRWWSSCRVGDLQPDRRHGHHGAGVFADSDN